MLITLGSKRRREDTEVDTDGGLDDQAKAFVAEKLDGAEHSKTTMVPELPHTQLLAKHPDMPMRALWEALVDNACATDVAMAIINDPCCGIERRSEDSARHNPADGLTLRSGATPLMLAALAGRDDVMKVLLSLNAVVDAKAETCDFTALHISAFATSSVAMEMLISSGADVNAMDSDGDTPLHCAAGKNNLEAVKLLIAKGSHMNVISNYGYFPLHCAARAGNLDVVKLLIDSGSHVKAVQLVDSRSIVKVVSYRDGMLMQWSYCNLSCNLSEAPELSE